MAAGSVDSAATSVDAGRVSPARTPSIAERAARGKAARKRAPRAEHAGLGISTDRPDPISILVSQDQTRVPELVPIRYGRMLASPFAFFRGAAAIMASDLANTPTSGLIAQCCGDAHLSNFGVFASPDRRLVFDINDFDETQPAPWEWDLKRLAASLVVASRDSGHSAAEQEQAALACANEYRTTIRNFAGIGNMDVWYARLEVETQLQAAAPQWDRKTARSAEEQLAKARSRDSKSAAAKLTRNVNGQPRIMDESPLIVPIDKLASASDRDEVFEHLGGVLRGYASTLEIDRRTLLDQFELVDVARKVVGVGSVGTRAWIALMLGADGEEPLFLQIKEAGPSVLEQHVGASEFSNHGQRVVSGQRLMQAAGDVLLGWTRVERDLDGQARDYYFRQLRDWKGSAEIDEMTASQLSRYAKLCGWTLARAHARSGDRVAIGAYLGDSDRFDRALVQFASAYADQNERDYQHLIDARAYGRVAAETGL